MNQSTADLTATTVTRNQKSEPVSSACEPSVVQVIASEFKNPGAIFRGSPFWSWNTSLDKDQLFRQIDYFKEMGMGGFHIHVRTGLATEYLGAEFLSIVRACTEHAAQKGMLTRLYDEDRWPSGFAGGLVTSDPKLRAKYLLFTPYSYEELKESEANADYSSWAVAARNGKGMLLGRYEIVLRDGRLIQYRRLKEKEAPASGGTVWYAYLETMRTSDWYNGQAYADLLNPEAIRRFIEVTHEAYASEVGKYFGNAIPTIFADEPQLINKTCLSSSTELRDLVIPWTSDLLETYQKAYGENLEDTLPEIFWELPDSRVSRTRYHYHEHISERFVVAFADQVGQWCEKRGLALTGHVMEEPTLLSQTAALGEAMRSYRSFQIPGIDILCDKMQFNTAKQAQSAARQYGRAGVLSEIYGVTNWDFDFLGHKAGGDEQAALGVTLRVHHLSWVSMAGEAKRDYPASISYQSPWYREYKLIEDHFARLNIFLMRGKSKVRVGVIHPIESFWLCFGPLDQTALERNQRETCFAELTNWMLQGLVDFDFIAESLLPSLSPTQGGSLFRVGESAYEVVVVPNLRTIRSSTLERLDQFVADGGQVIFMGEIPSLIDAVPSSQPMALAARSQQIPFAKASLLRLLEKDRDLKIVLREGEATSFLYQLRTEGELAYLFICNTDRRNAYEGTSIRIRGKWKITECDTLKGEMRPVAGRIDGEWTELEWTLSAAGSLLLLLEPGTPARATKPLSVVREKKTFLISDLVPVTLSEPNVLVLDQTTWQLNDEPWNSSDEILRIDNKVRRKLGLPDRTGNISQPWADSKPNPILGRVSLRFIWESKIAVAHPQLAVEKPEDLEIQFDGAKISNTSIGWWVDEAIRLVALPSFAAGRHELTLTIPFNRKTDLEWCYLLGDFGVEVRGRYAQLIEPVRSLAFGDWTRQGLPFYAGNVTYHCEVNCRQPETMILSIPKFKAPLLTVSVDGTKKDAIAFPPYESALGKLMPGVHKLDITAFGNRINAFGTLHNANEFCTWHGPGEYRTRDEKWAYEYQLRLMGILSSPVLKFEL